MRLLCITTSGRAVYWVPSLRVYFLMSGATLVRAASRLSKLGDETV